MRIPTLPTSPFMLADAAARGVSHKVLARLVRDEIVTRERRGLYVVAAEFAQLTPRERHLAIATTLAPTLSHEFAFGGHTAAVLHGLATPQAWGDAPHRVCLYAVDHRNSHVAEQLHVKATSILVSDLVDVRGVRATSLARTALDLARQQPVPSALIPLDSALALGATHDQLERQLARMHRWPGTRRIKFALPLADARSESPLESLSRGVFVEMHLPAPELQVWLTGASGRKYRVDFLWPEARFIGEADGWGKLGASPDDWRRSLQREKEREDDLRAAGYTVIRWTYDTLHQRARHLARLLTR